MRLTEQGETEIQKFRKELLSLDPEATEAQVLKEKSPEELFILFDTDDSGLISYKEFRRMLPYLGVSISDAKALRYFNLCDSDSDGEIDIEEFRVALYICNPTTGNTVGYSPYKYLTPLDAFQTFDDQNVGLLDEDEFYFALDYLGIKLTDEKQENLFNRFDTDKTGTIDYTEFREAFLSVCDIKRELQDRGEIVPTFVRRKVLEDLLRPLLIEDEERERKALVGALRFREWIFSVRETRRRIDLAKFRAANEMCNALDLGGHVYVFGTGGNNQFAAPPRPDLKTKSFSFEKVSTVNELWRDRVFPEQLIERLRIYAKIQEHADKKSGAGRFAAVEGEDDVNSLNSRYNIEPYIDALENPFRGLNVAENTAALWGRRISQVAVSESVIFALSDAGDVYAWGGRDQWWHEMQPDAQKAERGQTTPRSQLLLGTANAAIVAEQKLLEYGDEMTAEERYDDMIMVIAKYFEVWEMPPNPNFKQHFYDKELIPRIKYENIQFSLKMRGKHIEDATKIELMKELYEDILLEKRLLGERAHKGLREMEVQTAKLLKRKKFQLADKFTKKIEDLWRPLREVQAENRAEEKTRAIIKENNEVNRIESDYISWRKKLLDCREDTAPRYTPRGNSLELVLSGITPRGNEMLTPRGYAAISQIAAGAAHACLVHQSGQLYAWGVGAAGRLGLDITEKGDPQADSINPKVVQALLGRAVIKVSLGHSHTGCVVAGGDLFMFGSANSGKCGLGRVSDTEECYCSIPTRVPVGLEDRPVRRVSCGSSHTAVCTENGLLYVFGSGDGGRLGLGPGVYDTVYVPTLVESLTHERITSVSCGNSTTIALSEVKYEWRGEYASKLRELTGGTVYVAGSGNVLGKQYDTFTSIEVSKDKKVLVKQASAGFSHTALVTVEGELYCWGRNDSCCCAAPPTEVFIPRPRLVHCLFAAPMNIAIGKRAYQSSVFNCLEASIAINGSTDGGAESKCSSTQIEAQPWWEIDLGDFARIDQIKIWNRSDSPRDTKQAQNLFSKRLFPCWVMIGTRPFSTFCSEASLKENLSIAIYKVKFTEESRLSVWKCPVSTRGRYVRIQLEGFNFLSLCEVEIFGSMNYNSHGNSRVSQAIAGKDVTVAVVRASVDPYDVELGYKRAAYADACNADILRQYETFSLEYDKFGRCDLIPSSQCTVCIEGHICETCSLYKKFTNELKLMPAGIGGRRHNMQAVANYLMIPKYPPIELPALPKKVRASKWRDTRKQLMQNLNPRNWLGMLLMESEREAAIRLQPIDLYHGVEEELGVAKRDEHDEIDRKIAQRRRRLQQKKLRGKGVFVTNKELGAKVVESHAVDTMGSHQVRSAYPRSVIKQNEEKMHKFMRSHKEEAVNVKSLLEDEERLRLNQRFFNK